MCPHYRTPPVRFALVNDVQAAQIVFTLLSFFPSSLFSLIFFFSHFTSSSNLSFLQHNTINHGLHLRIIQKLCLHLRACSVGTVPFRSPIQMDRFLPFQNGKNPLFTVETVAERNGTVPTEQALSHSTPLVKP